MSSLVRARTNLRLRANVIFFMLKIPKMPYSLTLPAREAGGCHGFRKDERRNLTRGFFRVGVWDWRCQISTSLVKLEKVMFSRTEGSSSGITHQSSLKTQVEPGSSCSQGSQPRQEARCVEMEAGFSKDRG